MNFSIFNKVSSQLVKAASALIVFTLIHVEAFCQLDPGIDPDVPVDGGLSLLVAAGAAYGAKKIQQRKRITK